MECDSLPVFDGAALHRYTGSMAARNPPLRWPQFGLRTPFVVTTILGTFLGCGEQLKSIPDRREAL